MSSFVLIPGAGGMASYWMRVAPLLERAGHEAIAVDLPGDDESKGLEHYAALVVEAIGGRTDATLVAQSLGGFTAPLVCAAVPVRSLVLVNAMIPRPGETAGAWWANTGATEARIATAQVSGYATEFDLQTYFLHDVPAEVLRESPRDQRQQGDSVFAEPCRFERWPPIPIRVIAAEDDRFFPVGFQRRVAGERLGLEAETLPGGHLVGLSNPQGLTDLLIH